jgi:NAD(P)-dependent dehydrogenase (short-subunit alcohol dehydrogenase family)
MKLEAGQVAVVTGAASGIGLALAHRLAAAGLDIVLSDIEPEPLEAASKAVASTGVRTLAVRTDVSLAADVDELAERTITEFGSVNVVCNNAGVASQDDPWIGPLDAWTWVIGVNLMGVVHGVRAFLPHLVAAGQGHIVNTASVAGLIPGMGPAYSASKHGVVALSEDLFHGLNAAGIPIGVTTLCPSWVQTSILDAERNRPGDGDAITAPVGARGVLDGYVRRALAEGATPAWTADQTIDAIEADRFWAITNNEMLEIALERWQSIAERQNPVQAEQIPGFPPRSQLVAEMGEAEAALQAEN